MTFDRAIAFGSRSIAAARFNRDLTAVNDFYWGSESTLQSIQNQARKLGMSTSYRAQLGLSDSKYLRPLRASADLYADQLEVAGQWMRRSALLVIASALERYVSAISSVAAASDPTLTAGFPKKVDGLFLLKYDVLLPQRSLDPLVKGTWPTRVAAYKRLFGSVPSGLQSAVSDLEKMRVARNKIAHSFGFESPVGVSGHLALSIGSGHQTSAGKQVNVSEASLLSWFGAADKAAKAIDKHLVSEFIGGYEPAALYIDWDKDPKGVESTVGVSTWKPMRLRDNNAKRFLVHMLALENVDNTVVRDLIAYVRKL